MNSNREQEDLKSLNSSFEKSDMEIPLAGINSHGEEDEERVPFFEGQAKTC